jgi:hypothetical protein
LVFGRGGKLFRIAPDGKSAAELLRLPETVLATPAVDGGRLVLPTLSGKLWVLDLAGARPH